MNNRESLVPYMRLSWSETIKGLLGGGYPDMSQFSFNTTGMPRRGGHGKIAV